MASQFNATFNGASDKVVKLSEWAKKTRALYKENLTLSEKLFLNLASRPMAVVAAACTFNNSSMRGAYLDTDTNEIYVSGALIQNKEKETQAFMPNEAFQKKINGLSSVAFDQSEDHSAKPIMQRLKRL